MSTKRTKADKALRKADQFDKRLNDRPEDYDKKEAEQVESGKPDLRPLRDAGQK